MIVARLIYRHTNQMGFFRTWPLLFNRTPINRYKPQSPSNQTNPALASFFILLLFYSLLAASSKPAASNWSTNSVSPNKSTKTIADTKSSVHQPAAIEQSISKLDRAEDNGRCMSSASSTCTYASCSSNYASDASSVSYTYSPLDTNAVSQRISRSAILQNFQQRSSGASSTNERNHGCQSTDSGNHSDESLGVDETTTVSSTLDTKNLPSVNSKIESANAINRIVIDVPPADAYEPFQSEHIYEELRCSSTSYSPDRRSIFEGASRQQILEYLADAKRRVERLIQNGADCDLDTMTSAPDCSSSLMLENARKRSLPPTPPIRTDSIKNSSSTVVTTKTTSFVGTSGATAGPSNECKSSKTSSGSDCSDCSECIECTFANGSVTVERQDSGVGAETSASACVHNHELSRSLCTLKIDSDRIANNGSISNACVDCDQSLVNAAIGKFGASHSLPLASSLGGPATTRRQSSLCSKCEKRRTERKEIIAEFVDTEFKYGRDLRIIREEFHRPIRVAGLLSAAQLDGVFANLDELIQVNSRFSEKLQDTLDLATEQGDAVCFDFWLFLFFFQV